jgi:VWFA-related protein
MAGFYYTAAMRSLAVAACCVLALGSAPSVRQGQPPFKSGVTLVTIDVTVLDRDGRPVQGLKSADFEVKLNGRVQPIRELTYLQITEAMAGAVGPVFETVTPAEPVKEATAASVEITPRLFILLIDDMSFSPLRGKALFAAAQRFVAGLPPNDLVGVATTTGTLAINPAKDRALVAGALAKMVGAYIDPKLTAIGGRSSGSEANSQPDQGVGLSQALDIDRGDRNALQEAIARECFNGSRDIFKSQSLEQVIAESQCASAVQTNARLVAAQAKQTMERQVQAYQSVIRAMRPASGIKHLVLVTDGIAVSQEVVALAPIARAAAEAGVQVSVVMENADMSLSDGGRRDVPATGTPQSDTGAPQRRREDTALFLNGAKTVADLVGGNFYHVAGTPDPFFQRVGLAASAVYRLAIEAPANTSAGRDFSLSATVRKPGVSVFANRRAVAAGSSAPAAAAAAPAPPPARKVLSIDEQLRAAIATGRPLPGIDIGIARTLRRATDPAQVSIDVAVEVPSSARGPLKAVFGVVDAVGALRSGRQDVEPAADGKAYRLSFSLPVAPGTYKLRFAVADATGAVGAVESVVDARLSPIGPFVASDLLRWTGNAAGAQPLTRDVLPAAATRLIAAIELYPVAGAAAPADVLVRLELCEAGADQTPVIERLVTPDSRGDKLTAEAEFPLDRLPAGKYSIRATVLSGATVLGTVSAPLEKR